MVFHFQDGTDVFSPIPLTAQLKPLHITHQISSNKSVEDGERKAAWLGTSEPEEQLNE